MPKKHRVKRQNYVAHLRKVEKERESYLEKRRTNKRCRETPNEEFMDGVQMTMEGGAVKKRRTEAPTLKAMGSMNEENTTCTAESTSTTTSGSSATAKQTPGKKDFFSAKPFKELVKASVLSSQATESTLSETSATTPAVKKSLKRRHY